MSAKDVPDLPAMTASAMIGLMVAALGGAAVGLERQWSGHAEGPAARFAGIRTFAMLGAIGGLCGWLWASGVTGPAVVLLGGAAGLTVAAYVAGSQRDIDGTTEVAALVVLAAGTLAGLSLVRLASAIFAVEVLLLVEKSRLHSFVRRIDDVELRAGVRFAAMALVILPLLPEGPYGPFGAVRPRQLWILVLFFSGLSFLGHILNRAVGAHHGYLVSGSLGGIVSSTNVTITFARSSRAEPHYARALAFGTVAANTVIYPRVLAIVGVLNTSLVPALSLYLAAPAAIGALALILGARTRHDPDTSQPVPARNPLQLTAALQMAAVFQAVLFVVQLAREQWGESGLLATAAILGLADVDALTMSMARGIEQVPVETATLALAVGILSNTAVKTAVAFLVGERQFRRIAAWTLTLMLMGAGLSIAWLT